MSIVFIGTPAFAVPSLRRLVADRHMITAVVTRPDRPAGRGRRPNPPAVKLTAQELGLRVLQPPSLRDAGALAELAAFRPEVIIAVAYGQILRRSVLDIPRHGVLNVHPSLLPRWRGAAPIASAILNGDEETGVTIMLMDEGMDSGPILAQERAAIEPADTSGSLTERLSEMGADLLGEILPHWLAGEITPRTQKEAEVTKSRILKKDDGAIDWSLPAVDIWRRVRAYNPWPGSHTKLDNDLIKIWEAWPLEDSAGAGFGTVVALTPSEAARIETSDEAAFAVQTGNGLLAVTTLQRAGRRAVSSGDFLRGTPGIIGRRLASADAVM